jgi:hypothetical protein
MTRTPEDGVPASQPLAGDSAQPLDLGSPTG